ncbi:hypothetical protein [Paracoccus aerodenitrificans]|uniref:hypothetical protein n=1 Tax=Paracoccus aerodenitrificans TaxID=3017781 RepID=UPI0022F06AC1|nr:hypothetical protein [Paracoccus aerodenitrificans]WBU62788.1 hypothetical protein PAE61_10415 [Paracoccus aerodenitrificans]
MRIATLALTLGAVLAVSGCSRFGSDSGMNPFGWFGGGSREPTTLEPEEGWVTRSDDPRQPVPQLLSAELEPLNEGQLLLVRAFAPVKGWWGLELITERPQPAEQLRPDDDGILRLVLIGNPPLPQEGQAILPASPESDVLNVALPISTVQLSRLRGIEIRSASGGLSLRP